MTGGFLLRGKFLWTQGLKEVTERDEHLKIRVRNNNTIKVIKQIYHLHGSKRYRCLLLTHVTLDFGKGKSKAGQVAERPSEFVNMMETGRLGGVKQNPSRRLQCGAKTVPDRQYKDSS